MGITRFPEWWRRRRRFPFLLPDLGEEAVIGSWGPLRATHGVVQMSVAVSVVGSQVSVSTYRGRPPKAAALEGVTAFNITQSWDQPLPWEDGHVFIDDGIFPCRMVFVTGLPHHGLYQQWELVIAGPGWSAHAQLLELPPDRLRLRMADNDDDHTDLKTAYRAWHR